jgi:hypothetical protein
MTIPQPPSTHPVLSTSVHHPAFTHGINLCIIPFFRGFGFGLSGLDEVVNKHLFETCYSGVILMGDVESHVGMI